MKMDNLNFLWNIAIFIRNDLSVHIIFKILIQITSPPSCNDISSLYWGCVYWCECNGAKLVQFLMDEIKSCPTVFVVVVFISRSCFPLIYVTQQGRKDSRNFHCSPLYDTLSLFSSKDPKFADKLINSDQSTKAT